MQLLESSLCGVVGSTGCCYVAWWHCALLAAHIHAACLRMCPASQG